MSPYTLKGSTELDARINADLQCITRATSPFASAGILLGSYGRGEGTPFINLDGSQSPFNDYDLIVIVNKLTHRIRQKFKALEKQLSEKLHLPVDLYPYQASRLRKCEFSLLNYEMKYGHKVIWGNTNILDPLPNYSHTAIPLSEGSRLLLNRGKLLLDIQQRLKDPEPLTPEEHIRFIKFIHKVWLAFGDCALLAEKKYALSYRIKKDRIQNLEACPHRDLIIEGYLKAIQLKEWGDFQSLNHFNIKEEFKTVRDFFLLFFPWYRNQYSAHEGSFSKNLALNLKWNNKFSTTHPREQLYDTILILLQNKPSLSMARFYKLQQRFS